MERKEGKLHETWANLQLINIKLLSFIILLSIHTIPAQNCSDIIVDASQSLTHIRNYLSDVKFKFVFTEKDLSEAKKIIDSTNIQIKESISKIDTVQKLANAFEQQYHRQLNNQVGPCDMNDENSINTGVLFTRDVLQTVREFITEMSTKKINELNVNLKMNFFERELETKMINLRNTFKLDKRFGEDKVVPTTIFETSKSEIKTNNCIIALRFHKFDEAMQIFDETNDDNVIYDIVNKIYETNVDSFDIIMKFAEKFQSANRKLLASKALYRRVNVVDDGNEMLMLINQLNQLVNQADIDLAANNEAIHLLNILKTKLKALEIDFLKSLFLNQQINDIKTGNELLNKTYYIDAELFFLVHKEFLVIAKFQNKFDEMFENLVRLTKSRGRSGQEGYLQIAKVLIELEYKVKDKRELLQLALKLKKNLVTIRNSHNGLYNKILNFMIKPSLPLSYYNLVFADKHCIRNVGPNQYLATGGSDAPFHLWDPERRNVYTNRTINEFGVWQIKHLSDDRFNLQSFRYKEYMYTALNSIIKGRRQIWMWIPGSKDDSANFRFELVGENVFIKGILFNEYLYGTGCCSAQVTSEWTQGHVYTQWNSTSCESDYCLWTIENCSHL